MCVWTFLHGRNVTFKRLLLPEAIVTVCIHLLLNTIVADNIL